MNFEPSVSDEEMLNVGDKTELAFRYMWLGYGCDVDAIYTITAIRDGDFGSGKGVQVTPAVQQHHPDKELVWYDTAHFKKIIHTK
jgi:hypothetical protein